ncbi:uncharacterized protein LY89DRAFT_731066 [Mollisia scopiformis]|uniref:Zn(2)-C6 fungal-type domain-containing protein n=1 Tax=Mollisia scopiformis TaxID=149040 RepID=A0A194XHW8_MOLSC|nr:uncharacterized protein LY89DRAFT_731066 [Mollisia scopiformis]KUJ19815.1 hypothetical protein LY89DRAFT_731066 [Mollisia scopiformis]
MSRRPQTCVDCAKRKIRCNKVIPCDVCEKRGTAHTCRRADVTDTINKRTRKSTSPGFSSSPAPRGSTVEPTINERLVSLVTALSGRVQRLEAKIDGTQATQATQAWGPSDSEQLIALMDQHVAKRARLHLAETIQTPSALHENVRAEEDDSGSGQNASDAEVEDAATVLEFLAWGRLKDSNLTSGIREPPNIHESSAIRTDADVIQGVQAWGTSPSSIPGGSVAMENLHISQIQELLPTKMQVFLLFEYHTDWLLFMHCVFHVPTLRKELDQFYDDDQGVINMTSSGLQWTALLFAIMCGSMACVKPHFVRNWGFHEEEQSALARRWYQASIECLNAARYQQYHNMYSVQTIASSTISAHVLGFSNSQSVLLASAEASSTERTTSDIVYKELGRRLWQQLAAQDWFSVPFSETYIINPLQFSTRPPKHCDEETMQSLPTSQPSMTTYGNFLFRVASLMPALQDRSSQANTLEAKYEQVLIFDKMMRELVMTQLPACLNSQTQIDPLWPSWVGVARRCLTITSAHKIIMIHRRFLGMSFRDHRYSFTRRTCLAAAKTIMNEMKQDVQDESPILWTTQAFSVAAGIILCLDNFNRHQSAREYEEHRRLVNDAIAILSQSVSISSIAARGTRLLSDLLAEQEKHTQSSNNASSHAERIEQQSTVDKAAKSSKKSLNVAAFVKKFCESDAPTSSGSPIATSHMPLWLQQDSSSQSYPQSRSRTMNGDMFPSFSDIGPYTTSQSRPPQQSFDVLESTTRRQDPASAPFFQHLSDSFDFRSLNWFDDLMGLAPSNSI